MKEKLEERLKKLNESIKVQGEQIQQNEDVLKRQKDNLMMLYGALQNTQELLKELDVKEEVKATKVEGE